MNMRALILRTLVYHWRSLGAVLAGIVIASTTLTGALLMGDSVRGTLRHRELERLAGATFALAPRDRTFTLQLGHQLAGTTPTSRCATLLVLQGSASHATGESRANHVQIVGIDSKCPLAHRSDTFTVARGEAALNPSLTRRLGAKPGDEIILRIPKPTLLPGDAAISLRSGDAIVLRLQVASIPAPEWAANFTLTSQGQDPLNVFVDLGELGETAELAGRVNTLLCSGPETQLESLRRALEQHWTLADAELNLVTNTDYLELRSRRVFLENAVSATTLQTFSNAAPLLTYLANLIIHNGKATPYSMVTAAGPPYTPPGLATNEIVVSQWLADDLGLRPGAPLDLVYYLPETGTGLVEVTNRFRVHSVVPLAQPHADPTLMPDFPGLENADSTRDWETGFPLKHTIRPEDEEYWKNHRGTPKAFVSLETGRQLWANRFGNATAIRVPHPDAAAARLASGLPARLDPAELGLDFQPVRARALAGVDQAQDFGQLFLGFSFFLIAAALLLVSVLLRFNLEQRAQETGILLALGFSGKWVRTWRLVEAAILTAIGTVLGILLAQIYAKALLYGMATIWRGATGGLSIEYYSTPSTLLLSLSSNVVMCLAVMWLSLRRQARQPAAALLQTPAPALSQSTTRRGRFVAAIMLLGAIGLALWASFQREVQPGMFFGAGALTILSGVSAASAWLRAGARQSIVKRLSLLHLGLSFLKRSPGRSLAVVTLLSLGTFLIVSLGAFRLDSQKDAESPASGTGGFALIAETVAPVFQDLNSQEARRLYGLEKLPPFNVVPFRVRSGDQADCLNLTRSFNPTILGVRPELLRDRFTFAGSGDWDMLQGRNSGAVPVIGDVNSIKWSMGKGIGDSLALPAEPGKKETLQIVAGVANSILQGQLIVAEDQFVRLFPGESGYRFFLIDARPGDRDIIIKGLSRALQDYGVEVIPTVDRLASLHAVQNTYLGTFQVLGGFGLLLGSVGLGVLVLRNVLERRPELAMLQATGFRRARVRRIVLAEHLALLGLGLGLGLLASSVAVMPALVSQNTPLPYGWLAILLLGVLANGIVWTWASTLGALRGDLLEALRNE